MLKYLLQDFKVYGFSKTKTLFRIITDRGSSSVFLFRLSSYFHQRNIKILSNLFFQLNIFLNNCEIASYVRIGSGFRIFHATGIVIGANKIGRNFSVFQHVTIGKNKYPDTSGRYIPNIGDNVSMYAGSVIAGPISVGDNVEIGANSVVTKDIPSNSKAMGNPSVILPRKLQQTV